MVQLPRACSKYDFPLKLIGNIEDESLECPFLAEERPARTFHINDTTITTRQAGHNFLLEDEILANSVALES